MDKAAGRNLDLGSVVELIREFDSICENQGYVSAPEGFGRNASEAKVKLLRQFVKYKLGEIKKINK